MTRQLIINKSDSIAFLVDLAELIVEELPHLVCVELVKASILISLGIAHLLEASQQALTTAQRIVKLHPLVRVIFSRTGIVDNFLDSLIWQLLLFSQHGDGKESG